MLLTVPPLSNQILQQHANARKYHVKTNTSINLHIINSPTVHLIPLFLSLLISFYLFLSRSISSYLFLSLLIDFYLLLSCCDLSPWKALNASRDFQWPCSCFGLAKAPAASVERLEKHHCMNLNAFMIQLLCSALGQIAHCIMHHNSILCWCVLTILPQSQVWTKHWQEPQTSLIWDSSWDHVNVQYCSACVCISSHWTKVAESSWDVDRAVRACIETTRSIALVGNSSVACREAAHQLKLGQYLVTTIVQLACHEVAGTLNKHNVQTCRWHHH